MNSQTHDEATKERTDGSLKPNTTDSVFSDIKEAEINIAASNESKTQKMGTVSNEDLGASGPMESAKEDITPTTTTEQEIPTTIPDTLEQYGKDEYLVKTIDWKNRKVRIITQNENGPCPLVAISNVLFLRGELSIQPPDREVVTFEYLVDRLADYLLNHAPTDEQHQQDPVIKRQGTSEMVLTYRHNLDSALSILPNLKTGLDVNVKFDHIHGFEPTAELAMFDLFQVDLVHGWIIDPQDKETFEVIVNKLGNYNKTVEFIVQVDEKAVEEEVLHQGFLATEFLRDTATQLTYYGLDLLLDSIPQDTLCVLFRNNHFSTVYKHPDMGLFMLVTDSGLVKEEGIVWESLGDVDQSTSEFLNGMFKRSNPQENSNDEDRDLDLAIAMSLQEQQMNHRQEAVQKKPYKKKNDSSCHIQ